MLRAGALVGVLGDGNDLRLADPPATAPATDLDKVQGNWKPLQCEYEGKPQMPETTELNQQITRVVFDKAEYHLYFKDTKADTAGNPPYFRLALANVALDATTPQKRSPSSSPTVR